MVKKYQITSFSRLEEKPAKPVTKFGGQPDWLEEPQWPVSKHYKDRLMTFIGQIVLDKGMLGNDEDKIAYIFLTHPENIDEDIYAPNIDEWDNNESAVIIQPGGKTACPTKNVKQGPCLFDEGGNHYEYLPELAEGYDPDYIDSGDFQEMEEPDKDKYLEQIQGNKIGGIPFFFRGDERPDGDWKLLLQMSGEEVPFILALDDMGTLFAFVSSDFKQGGLFVQS